MLIWPLGIVRCTVPADVFSSFLNLFTDGINNPTFPELGFFPGPFSGKLKNKAYRIDMDKPKAKKWKKNENTNSTSPRVRLFQDISNPLFKIQFCNVFRLQLKLHQHLRCGESVFLL